MFLFFLNCNNFTKRKIDNFDPYNVGYCYKYTHATYDWFCGPGSHIYNFNVYTLYCQKYWDLLKNRFDYFSNFYEYKS